MVEGLCYLCPRFGLDLHKRESSQDFDLREELCPPRTDEHKDRPE